MFAKKVEENQSSTFLDFRIPSATLSMITKSLSDVNGE